MPCVQGELVTLSPDIPHNVHALASALRNIVKDSTAPSSPEEEDLGSDVQSLTVEQFSWFVLEHQQPAVAALCVEGAWAHTIIPHLYTTPHLHTPHLHTTPHLHHHSSPTHSSPTHHHPHLHHHPHPHTAPPGLPQCSQLRDAIYDLASSVPQEAADVAIVLVQVDGGMTRLAPLSRTGVRSL